MSENNYVLMVRSEEASSIVPVIYNPMDGKDAWLVPLDCEEELINAGIGYYRFSLIHSPV